MSECERVLQVTALCARVGQKSLLKDVHLSLRKGRVTCLVGESGSGKTLTAHAIMGLLAHNGTIQLSGEIALQASDGKRVLLQDLEPDARREYRGREIAMIFQEPMSALNPVMSIGQQILEARQAAFPSEPLESAWSMVQSVLQEVQIDQPATRTADYPHQFSGGQRQRIMIAMALVCEPQILVADEPTTALDLSVQSEILSLIRQLQQRRQLTVLLITHDFSVVRRMAHHVVVMYCGEVVESGKAKNVLDAPQHAYTQRLINCLPENLPTLEKNCEHFNTPLLEISAVSVQIAQGARWWFGTKPKHLLKDITLHVYAGEIVALVGASGSGKSSLAKSIVQLLPLSAGKICIAGREISRGIAKEQRLWLKRQVQMVFQDPAASLNPRLTVCEVLQELMSVHQMVPESEQLTRIKTLLKDVQLPGDTLHKLPHQLSGGQKQRVSLARALCLQPALLICDEITSALDVSVQSEILQLLRQLCREKEVGILFISHDIGVVRYLCDRWYLMHKGEVVHEADVSALPAADEAFHETYLNGSYK